MPFLSTLTSFGRRRRQPSTSSSSASTSSTISPPPSRHSSLAPPTAEKAPPYRRSSTSSSGSTPNSDEEEEHYETYEMRSISARKARVLLPSAEEQRTQKEREVARKRSTKFSPTKRGHESEKIWKEWWI